MKNKGKIIVRHKKDGAIYYVTEKMYKEGIMKWDIVTDFVPRPAKTEVSIETEVEEIEATEEDIEELKNLLMEKGIKFHPNSGVETLRRKLKEVE